MKTTKSYSQDKTSFNHTLRTVSNLSTNVPYIRAASPSYPSYYKSNLTKSDNEKISFLTECLKEKEEELAILNKCLEEKENELKIYKGKNKKVNIRIINDNEENQLYEKIEIYEYEIEQKTKEILMLKKRIRNLLIYLKRKDNNILILDNELRMFEKENEEIKLDNKKLTKENRKLENINQNLLSQKNYAYPNNNIITEQKRENENLRNRFDNLFNELDNYRKRNAELSKELKKLKDDWNMACKDSESYELSMDDLNEKLKKLKKENEYLKNALNKNKIK